MSEMFSKLVPNLQLSVDATSIGAFMFCPTYYKLSIIDGFRGQSVDLEFGTLAHKGIEVYHRSLLDGDDWETAQLKAVKAVFDASGHWEFPEPSEQIWLPSGGSYTTEELLPKWVPWGGDYLPQWKCSGTEPFRNAKGNKAKCPYSFKRAWFPAPGPDTCGSCGSEIIHESRWVPNHKYKHRYNLLRLVAWYCEEHHDTEWRTLKLDDGRAAVEMSFRMKLPIETRDGESFHAVGYLDRVETFGGLENFITDLKTTTKSLNQQFFSTYAPNIQVDMYDLIGWFMFPKWDIQGVKIEAASLTVDGVRFAPHIERRNEENRHEFLHDLHYWLGEMEKAARIGHWPMNRRNCWSCGFREVCALAPSRRQDVLEQNFERNRWDPTKERT